MLNNMSSYIVCVQRYHNIALGIFLIWSFKKTKTIWFITVVPFWMSVVKGC